MSWKLPSKASSLRNPQSVRVEPGGFDVPRRLYELVRALPSSPRLIDVGADHGLLALAALRLSIADKVVALDRREGPLAGAAARTYIDKDDDYEFVLSDGLQEIETELTDSVVVAGMSGENAAGILESAMLKRAPPRLWAFQVNDGHPTLRRALFKAGFRVLSEWFVAESQRFFLNQVWILGENRAYLPTDAECELGPLAFSGHSPLMKVWIGLERARLARDLEGLKQARDFCGDDPRYQAIVHRDRLLAGQSLVIPAQTD